MNRLILLLLISSLSGGRLFSQSFDSSLAIYKSQYAQEKLHIHFDKDAYLPGETVWMKAYIQSDDKPSSLSKNLYFDWTDADGKLLLHSVSTVAEGGASSFYRIPGWVKNGVLHVKVYTQWMLNFDPAFLYNRDIPVLMPGDGTVQEPFKPHTSLVFFPEGGDLVNGVPSIVAFEAMNEHNRPVEIRGLVKTSKNITVDSFYTRLNGMGTMRLLPIAGEHYIASWIDERGELQTTKLPDAKANGLVLHVDPYERNHFRYHLEKSADASKLNQVIVIATMNHKVVYRNSLMLNNNKAQGTIDARTLPAGVLQLTALDADLSPLSERVVFVNNQNAFTKVQLKKESVSVNKRARNVISLEIPDSLVTNLSVSVTDAGLGIDSSVNIYSDLLLAGELAGPVPDAASFLGDAQNANENLDLLLLTHGWRRFNWEAVVSGKFPELKYPREPDFLSIKGEIKFSTGLDAQDTIAMLLISRDRKKHVLKLPVDAHGKFSQSGLFFYDSVQVVYKFNNISKLNRNGQIFLNSDLLPALTPAKADEPSFAWVKVPEVVLEKEMSGNLIEAQDRSVASRSMSYIVSPKTDMMGKNSENASHYLSDNFVGLRFAQTLRENTNDKDGHLTSYNPGSVSASGNNVNVTLDGSLVAMDDLKSINMKEVLFIRFLPKSGQKGLPTLAITSRQAVDQTSILENKTGFAVITGYTPIREFYQPKYDKRMEDYPATDFRSTLYWNPKLRLDATHRKANFVFYNNDISNKFRIIIEGVNQDGKLCRIEEIIK